jgi:hypothetical protein
MNDPTSQSNENKPRDAAYWAEPVSKLKVSGLPKEAINLNVEGRQLTGPLKGFGPMWQKTYKVRLSGATVSPIEVIQTWKEHFPKYWPAGNRFYGPLTGIAPGEVAVLNLAAPGGMRLSTGVMVIYADDESFTFMTPQGHILSAWITFSAYEEDGCTVAQTQALLRATDPLMEISLRLGGHKMEDNFWHHTLKSLAADFGVQGHVQQQVTCVDPKLQWAETKNIWQSAAIRTTLYTPVYLIRKLFKR